MKLHSRAHNNSFVGSFSLVKTCKSPFFLFLSSDRKSRNSEISLTMAEVAESPATSSSSIPPINNDHTPKLQSQTQVPAGFTTSPNGDMQMFPIMYPALVPGLIPLQNQEQANHGGGGIYAVPILPFMGPMSGIPSNTLIPLTYSLPTRRATAAEGGAVSDEQGQAAQQQQQHGPQRQVVVRRFQFAFQIDLLLILKLVAVIFVFNQDGSKQRLVLLLFFASIVYLYQTGALTPLIRWLSQGMHRAAAPPQPRPPVRVENAAAPEGENNVGAQAERQAGAENVNQENQANENPAEAPVVAENGFNWRVIVKEIQMIVFGFITSLLPGFHNVD